MTTHTRSSEPGEGKAIPLYRELYRTFVAATQTASVNPHIVAGFDFEKLQKSFDKMLQDYTKSIAAGTNKIEFYKYNEMGRKSTSHATPAEGIAILEDYKAAVAKTVQSLKTLQEHGWEIGALYDDPIEFHYAPYILMNLIGGHPDAIEKDLRCSNGSFPAAPAKSMQNVGSYTSCGRELDGGAGYTNGFHGSIGFLVDKPQLVYQGRTSFHQRSPDVYEAMLQPPVENLYGWAALLHLSQAFRNPEALKAIAQTLDSYRITENGTRGLSAVRYVEIHSAARGFE